MQQAIAISRDIMNLYSEVMVAQVVHVFICKHQALHHGLDGLLYLAIQEG